MCRIFTRSALFLCAAFLLNTTTFIAQDKKSEEVECLEVTGEFDESMKSLEGKYKVSVMRDNKVLETKEVKVNRQFKFILSSNVHYTIKLEKPGYIPRYMSVNTEIPKNADLEEIYKFYFATNLINEELQYHFEDDDIDFPIALVAYKKKCDCFAYDKKYTEELMTRLVNKIMSGGY